LLKERQGEREREREREGEKERGGGECIHKEKRGSEHKKSLIQKAKIKISSKLHIQYLRQI
jgi:hypothetical protein